MKKVSIFLSVLMAVMTVSTLAGATTIQVTANAGVHSFGEPNTQYYGQTFALNTGNDTHLASVTFSLDDYYEATNSGYLDNVDFSFNVFEWDENTKTTTGSALYTSATTHSTNQSTYESFIFNPNVDLSIGTEYIWYIQSIFDNNYGVAEVAANSSNSYQDGYFIFNNNDGLGWTTSGGMDYTGYDLAFTMNLSSGNTPPTPAVPEPGTMLLVGIGLISLAGVKRKTAK